MNLVQDLVSRAREDCVSSIDPDGPSVVHDPLQQVVDVIEGDGVVTVPNAAGIRRVGDAL
jgi:hypothetical protein